MDVRLNNEYIWVSWRATEHDGDGAEGSGPGDRALSDGVFGVLVVAAFARTRGESRRGPHSGECGY